VQLIEKSTFIKLKSLAVFTACLEKSTAFELEELSRVPEMEDRFVKFLKYIEILDAKDPSRVEGHKLISVIFSIDRFKAYQNVSLQLFDHESIIHEEETPKTMSQTQVPLKTSISKPEITFEAGLFEFVRDPSKQQEAINYLKAYRISDILFFRPPPTTPGRIETYYVVEETGRV
jgi:hypothetical protein